MQYNMLEAKSQLSKLVQAALAGEDVIIANNGIPVVRLIKIEAPPANRKPGAWAGLPQAPEDWDTAANAILTDELTGGSMV
ncbi:MAG: type II toxin-antitoxin system Phd/YefM family antitoxin [Methylococcales bacterium]